jgi:hypothetical protein
MLGRRVIPGQAGRPPPKDTERASAGPNRLKDRQTRDGGRRRKDIDVVEASLRTHPAHHGAKSRNRKSRNRGGSPIPPTAGFVQGGRPKGR